MISVKRKRIIRLKDPRLRRARTELRTLLRLVWQDQKSKLHTIFMNTNDEKVRYKVQKEIEALDHGYFHGPHGCCLCSRRDLDLVYNPKDKNWYCESCYEYNQTYYKKHPEEANWEDLYP